MRRPAAIALALLCAAADTPGQTPAPDAVVARAQAYMQEYQRQLAGIVGEERVTQRVVRADGSLRQQRDLVSDIMLVKSGDRVQMFRDVLEVDGKPIRDRDERLQKLFLNPVASAVNQANRIMAESGRYNIGVTRVLDSLMLPMRILQTAPAPGFSFRLADGVLRFEETKSPTIIRSGRGGALRDMPLRGWLMIDAETGRLRGANMLAANSNQEASADIRYEEDAAVTLLVPVTMQQRYRRAGDQRGDVLEVSSSYSKWRRFEVRTSETIGMPR